MPNWRRSRSSLDSFIKKLSHLRHNSWQAHSGFQYDPLGQEVDSIRLIEIIPDSNDRAIRCRMRNATISEGSYNCLSYTWLPKYPEHKIEVNGHILTVGENLYQFLVACRTYQTGRRSDHSNDTHRSFTTASFWIDAICIDQSNLDERNHQVRQMGQIYKGAQEVLMWLGKLDQDMPEFSRELDKLTEPHRHSSSLMATYLGRENHSLRDELCKFMTLPYWSRIWIAQEILLPDDTRGSSETVKVFLGSRVVGFASLYHLVCELKDQLRYMGIGMWAENGESRMYHAYGGWKKLAGRQISSWPSFEINLPELLAVFRHCKSGDRRDRIFALLSLTEERPRLISTMAWTRSAY
jgi:hypothetical protein